ncbi:MAG TPA: hypothetical protein VFO78_08860 [Candidatus Limnocylindrales bacterium]|nr:hypothetical protein [Candidatus Limnocylindrales bacterium]
MAESSRRAAGPVAKGGLPSALFVVASVERVPDELAGLADELTILFPWGSLLRGTLGLDEAAARGIAALVRPGGTVRAFVSVTDRDGPDLPRLDDAATAERLAEGWSRHGLRVVSFCRASADEVAATHSTWARRLAAGTIRPAWRIALASDEALEEAVADAI